MKKVIICLSYPRGHANFPGGGYEIIRYMDQPSFGLNQRIYLINLIEEDDAEHCSYARIKDVIHHVGDDINEEDVFVDAVMEFDANLNAFKAMWRRFTHTKFKIRCYINKYRKSNY